MKHLSDYIPTIVLNIIITIISLICGTIAHFNNDILTNFEVIIITISVFTLIKGIITFINEVWLKEFVL